MKNLTIGFLLIAALAFGGLYLQQARRAANIQSDAALVEQKLADLQSASEQQQRAAARLREELAETRADAEASALQAARLEKVLKEARASQPPAPAAATQTNSRPSNSLAAMLKNPEMREMIKSQQKTALAAMTEKNYGRLFADLQLTPDQVATLKNLIINKQLATVDSGLSMFSDDADATNRAAIVAQIKAANDANDAQIKQFLGDDNFASYQDYEKSVGQRMAVGAFQDQLGGAIPAMSDDQQQQLIQAMTQAQRNFKFTTDFSNQSKFTGDFTSMFTEDRVNTYFNELGQLDQQYVAQAQDILSPDQLSAFQKYLGSQQEMQKAGMQMAAKMFAPAK